MVDSPLQYLDSYKSAGQRLSFPYPRVYGNAKLTHNDNYILIHLKLYNNFREKYTLQPHLALTNGPGKIVIFVIFLFHTLYKTGWTLLFNF
jgi:hypothetical protein